MSKNTKSFKLSELPENQYLSPSFFFEWWDRVAEIYGLDMLLYNSSPDFRIARELWVAAIFATGKRIGNGLEHWIKAVQDNAPDAVVAFFNKDDLGNAELKYSIEVTTYGKHSSSIQEVFKAKLDKGYPGYTRIICFVTDREDGEIVNLDKISKFVNENNSTGYEVWILVPISGKSEELPFKLVCLTSNEIYDIDYNKEKLVKNKSAAFRLGAGKSTDTSIKYIGPMVLEFPRNEDI